MIHLYVEKGTTSLFRVFPSLHCKKARLLRPFARARKEFHRNSCENHRTCRWFSISDWSTSALQYLPEVLEAVCCFHYTVECVKQQVAVVGSKGKGIYSEIGAKWGTICRAGGRRVDFDSLHCPLKRPCAIPFSERQSYLLGSRENRGWSGIREAKERHRFFLSKTPLESRHPPILSGMQWLKSRREPGFL